MTTSPKSRTRITTAIAAAMGMAMCGALLAPVPASAAETPAYQPKPAAQHFSFKGQRPTFHEDKVENIEVIVSAADSEGHLSLIESDWTPEFQVRPHYHKAHHETFYIVSGQVEWTIGGQTRLMKAGDLVHIPPNTIHAVKVVGDEPMHSLMFFQPGGYEETYAIEAMLTRSQQRKKQFQDLIARVGDFYPVEGLGTPWQEPPAGQAAKGRPIFSVRGQRASRTEEGVANIEVALSSIDSEGQLSIIESDWLPSFNAPPHLHHTHAETFYIFSGKVEWTVGGETHVLGAGDAVHIPANTPHSVRVLETIHTLWIGTFGGIEEGADRAGDFVPVRMP